jgi:hypothetical protein
LRCALVNHPVEPAPDFNLATEFEQLVLLAERAAWPSTQALLDEASLRHPPDPLNSNRWCSWGGVHQK